MASDVYDPLGRSASYYLHRTEALHDEMAECRTKLREIALELLRERFKLSPGVIYHAPVECLDIREETPLTRVSGTLQIISPYLRRGNSRGHVELYPVVMFRPLAGGITRPLQPSQLLQLVPSEVI